DADAARALVSRARNPVRACRSVVGVDALVDVRSRGAWAARVVRAGVQVVAEGVVRRADADAARALVGRAGNPVRARRRVVDVEAPIGVRSWGAWAARVVRAGVQVVAEGVVRRADADAARALVSRARNPVRA